jgi:ATP-dependent helicase/nuclease subunit B
MPILRILPDAERVETAMLEAGEASGFVDGTCFRSFAQWVDSLEGSRFVKRRSCSSFTARVVLWSVARQLHPNPFGPFIQEPAFARGALELILDLKAGMLPPEGFGEAVRELPPARQHRARALADLYEAYDAQMRKLGLADREDLIQGAVERLRAEGLPADVARFQQVSVEGLYDFPPSRVALLVALAQACRDKGIRLLLELPGAGAPAIDRCIDGALAELERRHAEIPELEVRKEDLQGAGRPLAALGTALFSDAPRASALELAPDALTLLALPSARAEARELARFARQQVDRGVPPERVALCYRDLGEEAEWLEEALGEMGLAARIRRGAPLAATAVGRLALALPVLVDDGYPAGEVARALTSRYARAVSRPSLEAPARWLAAASVRDDRLGSEFRRGAYDVRLTALAERLEARDDAGAEPVRALLERCRKLFGTVGRIPEHAKAGELLDRWWTCVQELGVLEAIRQPEEREAEGSSLGTAVLRALARDQAAADALRDLTVELDAALKLSGAAVEPMHRRTFHRWLVDAAGDFQLSLAGPRAGAVRVLDVRELTRREFDAVCVGGVVDGRFPARDRPHALFPEDDRREVNRWARRDVFRLGAGDLGARTPWRLAEDRLLLYVALTASTGPVVLSYARTAANGAEQIPSAFLDEVARLTGQRVTLRPLAPVRSLDDAETELELRARLALEAFAPPALRTSEPEASGEQVRAALAREEWLERSEALVEIERERLLFYSDPLRAPGRFTGAVSAPSIRAAVEEAFAFGSKRPLDASTLGRFGNCAFQGFLEFVLRVKEPEEPGEELDSRGQGTFWHRVLERLFPELRDRGLAGRALEDVPDDVIDAALDQAAAEAEADTHVGHPILWKLGREKARAMVRRLLGTDHHGLPMEGLGPLRVEVRFGSSRASEGWREVSLPLQHGAPVHFRGAIDRLDTGGTRAGVLDYKGGSLQPAKLKDEFLVTQFQIPIYLHALRQSGHLGEMDAGWLSLKDGEPLLLRQVLEGQTVDELLATDPARREELARTGRKNLANAVEPVVTALRAGQFAARPQDCQFCAYRALCRISDRRIEENLFG